MTEHAEGSFTVQSWDESSYAELDGGGKLTRARMTFAITGDLEGESNADTLMCYRADGTAVYTGLERMVVRLGGRSGSFVLRTSGAYADGEARTAWEVIEGSGTGELAGLRGAGLAVAVTGPGGTFSLDYDLA